MKREHSLQVAVAHMLELVLDPERTWFSAIDHAAQLSARYGADRKRRGVKRGLPDFIILFGDGHLIGIELKAGKGRLSESQTDVAAAWLIFGCNIFVARSLEDVQSILVECGVPLRRRMNLFSKGASHEPAVRAAKTRNSGPSRRRRPAGSVSAM